eukprot:scaffold6043_cov315-Pinguiococcus_pyrenoidosus.AAC.6
MGTCAASDEGAGAVTCAFLGHSHQILIVSSSEGRRLPVGYISTGLRSDKKRVDHDGDESDGPRQSLPLEQAAWFMQDPEGHRALLLGSLGALCGLPQWRGMAWGHRHALGGQARKGAPSGSRRRGVGGSALRSFVSPRDLQRLEQDLHRVYRLSHSRRDVQLLEQPRVHHKCHVGFLHQRIRGRGAHGQLVEATPVVLLEHLGARNVLELVERQPLSAAPDARRCDKRRSQPRVGIRQAHSSWLARHIPCSLHERASSAQIAQVPRVSVRQKEGRVVLGPFPELPQMLHVVRSRRGRADGEGPERASAQVGDVRLEAFGAEQLREVHGLEHGVV